MNYFDPNETYVFRSRINETQTKVISVVFDEGGNATIVISSDSVLPGDIPAEWLFAPDDEYQINEQEGTITISGDLSTYWFIYFNNPGHESDNASAVGGGTITVTCDCKTGSGANPTCIVSVFKTPGEPSVCISCEVGPTCETCKDPKWSSSTSPTPTSTSLLIKANSIDIT